MIYILYLDIGQSDADPVSEGLRCKIYILHLDIEQSGADLVSEKFRLLVSS